MPDLFVKRSAPGAGSLEGEASPLADGWRERVPLHQLAPLLHHCALYGRAYARSALEAARPFA